MNVDFDKKLCQIGSMSIKSKKPDPEIAKRALQEAEERRKVAQANQQSDERPAEFNGRKGPDPARYGDWENKGIASDF